MAYTVPTVSTGYASQGTTTIVWGTDGLWSTYIVSRATEKDIIENVKLTNGTGITLTRVQLKDGRQWDLTVRDDTAMTPPTAGSTITVVDAGGLISSSKLNYTGRVVESSWDTSSKQAAERSVTVENLILIESQTGS
tara:strand:+ start:15298 stop:15708 length:411 start_codon:yes stop_codon:yes gene_type:complete